VSCNEISSAELAKTIPVRPPIVNKNKNPKTHRIGVSKGKGVPDKEASHENTFTPVGTAITIVAEVK